VSAQRCREIAQRAEKEFGRRYREMKKPEGTRGQLSGSSGGVKPTSPEKSKTQTLKDLRITGHQAADWQRVASLSDEEFDRAVADGASTSDMVAMAKAKESPPAEPPTTPVSEEALWIWGRIMDMGTLGMAREYRCRRCSASFV
jgi:hypothetical protein